ncbi:MAG: hypothetical protein R5N73_09340, partial [Cutibacterium granulosum]|nr:hypothetical protein [Cutibacterium granulosum]
GIVLNRADSSKLSNLRYGGSAYGYGYSKYDSNYRASTDKTPRTDSTTRHENSEEVRHGGRAPDSRSKSIARLG